jgi:hypothetical protein
MEEKSLPEGLKRSECIQRGCEEVLTFFSLKSVTESFAGMIHGLKVNHLTDGIIRRSKRMILDSLGVGFLGTGTEVFHKVTQYSKVRSAKFAFKIKQINKHACTPPPRGPVRPDTVPPG